MRSHPALPQCISRRRCSSAALRTHPRSQLLGITLPHRWQSSTDNDRKSRRGSVFAEAILREGDVPHFPGQQVRNCLERVLHVLWGNEGKKGAALCAHPVSVRALVRVPVTRTEHAQKPRHVRHETTWLLQPLDAYSLASQPRWKRTTRQERLSEL